MKKTKPVKTKDMILSGSVGTRKPDRTAISNTIYLESELLAASSLDVKIEMNSNYINNSSKKDFLNISESYINKKSIKNSKTSSQIQPYDQARKKLISFYYQKPTVEQMAKFLLYKMPIHRDPKTNNI